MPYNPNTGKWDVEDASVSTRVNDLMASSNPLIKQARQQGLAAGNRRGLLNSSMSVGASEAEAFKAAIPIAGQEAGQVHQSNLAELARRGSLEQVNVEAGHTASRQAADLAAQMERLRATAGFTSDQQRASDEAQMARLRESGTISTAQQTQAQAAQMAQLRESLTHATGQQREQIQAQMAQLERQIAGQSALAGQQAGYQQEQITLQGNIAATAADKQAAQEWARLQSTLTNSNAQQQAEIKSRMDQLQATSQANLAQLAAQAGFAAQAAEQQFGYQQIAAATQHTFQKELTNLQGTINSALQKQGAEQTVELEKVRSQLQSQLQSQANSEQLGRMAAEFAQQTKMQASEQANAMERLTTSGNQEMARQAAQIQGSLQQLGLQIAQQDRSTIAATMTTIFQQEANMRAALLSNTAMPAAERAAYERAISTLGNPMRNFVSQLYGGQQAPGGTGTPAPPNPGPGDAPPIMTTPPATGAGPVAAPVNPATGAVLAPDQIGYSNGKFTDPTGNVLTAEQVQAAYTAANWNTGGGLNAGGAITNQQYGQPIAIPTTVPTTGGLNAGGALPVSQPIATGGGISQQVGAIATEMARRQRLAFSDEIGDLR